MWYEENAAVSLNNLEQVIIILTSKKHIFHKRTQSNWWLYNKTARSMLKAFYISCRLLYLIASMVGKNFAFCESEILDLPQITRLVFEGQEMTHNFLVCLSYTNLQEIIMDGPIFLTSILECRVITPGPSPMYAVSTFISNVRTLSLNRLFVFHNVL